MEFKYSWTRLKSYKSKQDEKIRLKVERTKYQIVDKFAGSMIIASMNWEAQNKFMAYRQAVKKGIGKPKMESSKNNLDILC